MKEEIQELFDYLEGLKLSSEQLDEIRKRVGKMENAYDLVDFKFQKTITEKQAIIRFLSKVSEDLNKKMHEVELKNQALKEAQEIADKANQAKSNFLAIMSHEIRTPMNGYYGMLQLLEQSPLNEEQKDYVKVFKKSGEDLLHLIDNLLDFSKIEANKLNLEQVPFSLPETLIQLGKLAEPKAIKKDLFFEINIEDSLPDLVEGDVRRLQQILNNLLDNAIKFTSSGGISINAKIIRFEDQIATCQISVQDTGIGIPKTHIEKLFKPFTQADNSIGRRFGGTGLGLSISIELARLMDGDLKVESMEGIGSTFLLEIPFQVKPVSPRVNELLNMQDESIAIDSLLASKHPARILIVEDNEVNQLLMEVILKKMGYKLKKASDGYEAIAYAEERPFDLIFMDFQLPEISGFETTKRILSLPNLKTIPKIVGISANVSQKDRDACIEVGMDDFLPKPFQLGQIEDIIKKWVPASLLINS